MNFSAPSACASILSATERTRTASSDSFSSSPESTVSPATTAPRVSSPQPSSTSPPPPLLWSPKLLEQYRDPPMGNNTLLRVYLPDLLSPLVQGACNGSTLLHGHLFFYKTEINRPPYFRPFRIKNTLSWAVFTPKPFSLVTPVVSATSTRTPLSSRSRVSLTPSPPTSTLASGKWRSFRRNTYCFKETS